mmetsp:Transcript_9975/g.13815  ORF Transcript_9975/g.13815 Transcript_9975/m.13815 type:complete len:144 (-) Transcript_9975:3647-4078(-)
MEIDKATVTTMKKILSPSNKDESSFTKMKIDEGLDKKTVTPCLERKRNRGSCSPFGNTPTIEQAKDQRHGLEKEVPPPVMTPTILYSTTGKYTPQAPIKEKHQTLDKENLDDVLTALESAFDQVQILDDGAQDTQKNVVHMDD